jgi:hypothetical protein
VSFSGPYTFWFFACSLASKHILSLVGRPIANMPKADSPGGFKPLRNTALFTPFKLGALSLEHRVVQAPLTRMRAVKESDAVFVPENLHVKYYEQRASKGGLQLTEATDISIYVSILQSDQTNID